MNIGGKTRKDRRKKGGRKERKLGMPRNLRLPMFLCSLKNRSMLALLFKELA